MKRTIETHSEEETIQEGMQFARLLKRGDVVALSGDLGAGKTRLAQGICRGLGVSGHVTSPTFTIVNEYAVADFSIYHFDFYRIKSLQEVLDIGFEEYLSKGGICVIEWADRVQKLLPADRYDIGMVMGRDDNARVITIEELREVAA